MNNSNLKDEQALEHLKSGIEGERGADNAIFSAGILSGMYLRPMKDEDREYRERIKSIIYENIDSKIPFVAQVCLEFKKYIEKKD